jgi:hypothetical protein
MSIVAAARKPPRKKKPRTAVEGIGWQRVDVNGEVHVRCKRCNAVVPALKWWTHGEAMPSPCNVPVYEQ